MKHSRLAIRRRVRQLCGAAIGCLLLVFGARVVCAQQGGGGQRFNPYRAAFVRAWDFTLSEPVKLIEIAPVTPGKNYNLLMLVAAANPLDPRRKLLVTHWDGFRFVTDASVDCPGATLDTLLAGRLREPKAPAEKLPKGQKAPPTPTAQVLTTQGVYEWLDGNLSWRFAAPPGIKLSVVPGDRKQELLIGGIGESVTIFQVGENAVLPASVEPPEDGPGWVRYGVGLQEFSGSDALQFGGNLRFAQTLWLNSMRWFIGVLRGTPAATTEEPNATTGDRLVVYTPKAGTRETSFWKTKREDLEESWRSDPLPGHILDVRVGDPKNELKPGILVLTSENGGKLRHLYFYAQAR